jgi:hypothetical protein
MINLKNLYIKDIKYDIPIIYTIIVNITFILCGKYTKGLSPLQIFYNSFFKIQFLYIS